MGGYNYLFTLSPFWLESSSTRPIVPTLPTLGRLGRGGWAIRYTESPCVGFSFPGAGRSVATAPGAACGRDPAGRVRVWQA